MKTLSLIVLAAVSFGALVLSGCSGCSEDDEETTKPAVYCGTGTVPQNGVCVSE
ncbi:MAG: hypothetical protein AAB268_01935 [Elusimicrobiota bacterium]